MTLTATGSVAFTGIVQPLADQINAVLGDRIGDAKILAKTEAQMPKRSDGGPSFGFWRSGPREISLWDELGEYPFRKTLWHEAMHVLDDDYFTREQRLAICALMTPAHKGWRDDVIAGKRHRYVALPSECFAVYGSAALGNLAKPAYTSLFLRKVPQTKWPQLAALSLQDFGPVEPEPLPPEPVPTPPDPAQAEIERLQALLAEISTDNAEIAAQSLTVSQKAKQEVP